MTPAAMTRLRLGREQVLAHRRRVGALDRRLPHDDGALRRAAWAGLTDSVPRAALLSLHARVEGTTTSAWQDPALVQVWGPRFSAYVVAAPDRWVFTLGRTSADPRRADEEVTVSPWLDLTTARRESVEQEAASLPLPGLRGPVTVRWATRPGDGGDSPAPAHEPGHRADGHPGPVDRTGSAETKECAR